MKTHPIAVIVAGASIIVPSAHAFWGVGDVLYDPAVHESVVQKNIFDQVKYAWEQAQWADKLATLHHSLTTLREQRTDDRIHQTGNGKPERDPHAPR